MVAKSNDEHFAGYTPNTRIKHEILRRYLKVYLTALSGSATAFHYIDGFAGRGKYGGNAPGSPLLALELLGEQSLPFFTSFVEVQPSDADDLREAVATLEPRGRQVEPPLVLTGEFADHIEGVLTRPGPLRFGKTATFAFVDPCRVKGVRVADIRLILAKPFGECLIFWNYDGVNRWLGAVVAGESSGEALKDLFGDTIVLQQALDVTQAANDSSEKESELLKLFIGALKSHSGATHVLPFRFDARDRARTSHYLVHCSRNGLAFALMKEVMSSVSSTGEPGNFEFLGESDIGLQADMFRPGADELATQQILAALGSRSLPISVFCKQWVRRPDDFFSERQYKRLLLALEEKGQIEVLESDGETPMPRYRRPKRHGQPTLGDRYWVRLRQ